MKRVGLIVNPVAGMGGRVALKGSDGPEVLARARALGAVPTAPARAVQAIAGLRPLGDRLEVLVAPGPMGEEEVLAAGLTATVVGTLSPGETTAEDTRKAARAMRDRGVDLVLFAGGDGTARDVFDAVGTDAVTLGIPAGVKIHSAVYAASPAAAGELARLFLEGRVRRLVELEVMDIDETAFRQGEVRARLYGYLKVPDERRLTQGAKTGSTAGDELAARGIADAVVEQMRPGRLYLIGSGTTTRAVMRRLHLPNTLLGIDAVRDGRLVAADAAEADLLTLLDDRAPATIVVTPIGGQGYLLGRGNQQLSPAVLRRVGPENLQVIATKSKVNALPNARLRVDTGDPELDAELRGFRKVRVGYAEEVVLRVV